MPAEVRPLQNADRRALAREVVASLRQGQLVALPTETVYGAAALPSAAGAAARLRHLRGLPDDAPFALHLAARADWRPHLAAAGGAAVAAAERLATRYWPGPLTLVVPARGGGQVGLRVPAHEFTRQVIEAAGEPLFLSPFARPGETPRTEAAAIAQDFGAGLGLVIDGGRSPLGSPSTVVQLQGPRLQVLREGILSAAEVLATAALQVLFVCTGNTCRSPLAEALAHDLLARTLGVPADEVLAHGFQVHSAGTSTLPGMPASEGSLQAGAELGLDLGGHQSRVLDPELVQRADRIYCLGQSHRRALLAEFPAAAGKVQLLRPDGLDIADPYGGDLATYRRTRDEIRAAVGARVREWLASDGGTAAPR